MMMNMGQFGGFFGVVAVVFAVVLVVGVITGIRHAFEKSRFNDSVLRCSYGMTDVTVKNIMSDFDVEENGRDRKNGLVVAYTLKQWLSRDYEKVAFFFDTNGKLVNVAKG